MHLKADTCRKGGNVMNFKVIKQLYKKEILDVLRDKKTIIMMVIVPLLIYPLMFVGGMVMMSKVTTQMDTQTYEIAVDFMDTNPELVEMFLHPDDDTLHFKLCDLNVMDADISMILRGEKINAIVYEMKMELDIISRICPRLRIPAMRNRRCVRYSQRIRIP